jgi:CRP/FNR family transcriptional regulator, cyclic AMP receptor protein
MERTGTRLSGIDSHRRAPAATRAIRRDEREARLRQLARLAWLPEDRLKALAAVSKVERVKARATVNIGREIVRFVLRGAVRIQYTTSTGHRTVISIAGPGEMLSKLFFKEAPHVRADAVTDCTLLTLPRGPFLEAIIGTSNDTLDKGINVVFGEALALLARYWQTLGDRLVIRLAMVLMDLARKFGVADARGTMINLKLSQNDLAGLVGCSRQQVHALLDTLVRQDLVSRQGRQLIVRLAQLEQLIRRT